MVRMQALKCGIFDDPAKMTDTKMDLFKRHRSSLKPWPNCMQWTNSDTYCKWSKVSAGTDDEHALFVDACWCVPVQLLWHRSFLDVGR